MIERQDPRPYDREQFLKDLEKAATAISAPFNRSIVARTLEVFDEEFHRCVVQMKATCKPGSGVYYRFFYKWEKDLTSLAQQQGMIQPGRDPIVTLQEEILNRFPGSTRAGLDFDTGFGLAKVWTFTGGPAPVDRLLSVSAIPQSVHDHKEFFARHSLKHVFFVCSDYQQNTMNIYFGLEPECRNEQWLQNIVNETGGAPEDEDLYKQMLASLAVSAGVGMTFRWDGDEMGRWCLYGLNIPYFDKEACFALPPLPPRLEIFRDQAPTLNVSPQFNVAWSFGKAGFYTKLEKSYARDADYFLTIEMGGDLSHLATENIELVPARIADRR